MKLISEVIRTNQSEVVVFFIVFLPETPPTDKHPNKVADLISEIIQFF